MAGLHDRIDGRSELHGAEEASDGKRFADRVVLLDDRELRELAGRLKAAGERMRDEEAVTCCYAQGNKSWVTDQSGLRWETFHTLGEATTYGEDAAAQQTSGCGAGSMCC